MPQIETRVLSRLLLSFSRPESGDGENLSAAEMLTVVEIAQEFPQLHEKLKKLFAATHAIAVKLEENRAYQLNETEQKTVMSFFGVVEKSIAFQKREMQELDFVSLQGLEDVL